MTIRAIYFDLGGVIVRTEFQSPRQHLAERCGLDYEGLVKLVFDSPSAAKATVGKISEDEHWITVMHQMHIPEDQIQGVRDEFFAGDVIDLNLVNSMRALRENYKVGLISNAWSGLRPWIMREKFDDAFDAMTISAEVGVMKPDKHIFQKALDALEVTAAEAVFLDDFPDNVKAAREYQMNAIHFVDPEQAIQELKQILANHS